MAELIGTDKLAACSVVDCRPRPAGPPAPPIPRQRQAVDYMAKDYDSLLRAMLDLLPEKLPGWKDRTEADLGMAILELFAFLGDQLSYFQDRVSNEAYLRTATQYESVRKLLRLIDYVPDPGLAARTILQVNVPQSRQLPAGFPVATSPGKVHPAVVFETTETRLLFPALNTIGLASDAPSNAAGTEAVLDGSFGEAMLPVGSWLYFESAEGGEWGRVLDAQVNPGPPETTVRLEEPLQAVYRIASTTVRGNGVAASHGESRRQTSTGAGTPAQSLSIDFEPLTYVLDEGSGNPVSTLRVTVDGDAWIEVENFIDSGPADHHFRTSRANNGYATIHFGDGTAGRIPPEGANIVAEYRTGIGEAGLVAKGTLRYVLNNQRVWALASDEISRISNPRTSFGGRDPETVEIAKLAGPRQMRKLNRAVTPADYEAVLRDGVAVGNRVVSPLHVKAYFRFTGSWTTVFVSVEMPGRTPMSSAVHEAFAAALREKKLAGNDVRLEPARYAPLYISLIVHVKAVFFARHVRQEVEKVLGSGVHDDGTVGFFAPEALDFGQNIYLSDLYAAVMTVEGIESIGVTRFKRLGDRHVDRESAGFIPIPELEIAQLDNDPAHPERGVLFLRTCGGKEG